MNIAIGPKLPEFGSWQWLGEGLTEHLSARHDVSQFIPHETPTGADCIIFLKFLPGEEELRSLSQQARVVFLPVDIYDSSQSIDQQHAIFEILSQVVVHCRRLVRYFSGYCPVDYLDHPLKFISPAPRLTTDEGPLVWVGRSCNLPPMVRWANTAQLDRPLWLLTNLEGADASPASLGIRSSNVVIENWTCRRHLEYLEAASAVIDLKADDFRSRHKPPAKVLDFLASGIPAIVNRGSSADYHLRALKFQPLYPDNWQAVLTKDYRRHILGTAHYLREQLSPHRIWSKFENLLNLNVIRTVKPKDQ